MFTTDELEAAGRRAANHPVETIPDVAKIQSEVARRRQSKRLLIGASTASVMLVAVGGLLLLNGGEDPVQVITASPVLQSEANGFAGQEARTDSDGRSADERLTPGSRLAGDEGEAGATGEGGAASSSSAEAESSGDGNSVATVDVEAEAAGADDVAVAPDTDDADDATTGDDGADDAEEFDDEFDITSALPEDFDAWLERLEQWDPLQDDWRDMGPWPFWSGDVNLDVLTGRRAETAASGAEADAEDALITDGRTVWVDRATKRGRVRNEVTVSSLVDDQLFVSATGPADNEAFLLRLVVAFDGDWNQDLIPRLEELDTQWDRVRPVWPPSDEDYDDWEKAREEWLKEQEEWLKKYEESLKSESDRGDDRDDDDDDDDD